MFSQDPESNVDEVDFSFMQPKPDNFWDWPKKKDEKRVNSKFIFYGPCMPEAPTKNGFHFADEDDAMKQYKVFRNSINKMR